MGYTTLSHLNNLPKDITKFHVSYYSVALEAWRRRLKITFHNYNRGSASVNFRHQYSISNGTEEYQFLCARGSNTTDDAIDILENKYKAYSYFKKAGVPIPEGSTFNFKTTSVDEIIEFGQSIGFPLVVKPTSLGGGKGVFTHIKNSIQLKESLLHVKNRIRSEDVMVEKYINGIDYRLFVIGDKVLAASKSYSSFVVGDGENTVNQLIDLMNQKLKKNLFHKGRDILINDDLLTYLDEQGFSLSYVPDKNERIFLRRHGTYLNKRLNVDCTDYIDSKFKDYAVKAINSVSGIPYGSVDMIIDEDKNEGVVNEVNTKGEISMHLTPIEGVPRDIPKAIIDYYFPNTERISETLYFEMKPIKDLLLAGLAEKIVIPRIPVDKLYHQNFTVTGKNLRAPFLERIYRRAARLHLMGTIQRTDLYTVKLDLFGEKSQLNKYFTYLKKSSGKKSLVKEVNANEIGVDTKNHPVSLELNDYFNEKSRVNLKS